MSRAMTYPYLGPSHPLAEVARQHCRSHRAGLVGRVACGRCWERAIRDDERVVIEHELPREVETDPEYVDAVAVDLACRGERVSLTPADVRAAVALLRQRQTPPSAIARRLHIPYAAVTAVLDETAPTACTVPPVAPAVSLVAAAA